MYLRALIDQSCSEIYFWVVDNWMYLHTGREICFWNTLYPSILKHKWASETANQIITVILRVLSLHLEPHNWVSRIIMSSVDTWWLVHQKDALIYKVLCFFSSSWQLSRWPPLYSDNFRNFLSFWKGKSYFMIY